MAEHIIKFKVYHKSKLIGIEELANDGWRWMAYDLNPDSGERWTIGTFPQCDGLIRAQFTGLLDINGIEVYRGDKSIVNGKVCEVRFESLFTCGWELKPITGMGCYPFKSTCTNFIGNYMRCKDLEVIGNIFEPQEEPDTK